MPSTPQRRRVLGENIRARRKQLGWSHEALAEKTNLHPVYVGSLERGHENVSIDSLAGIAKSLKVTLRDVLGGV